MTVHASCVLAGEGAVLIRGEAGAGKSTLARSLLEAASVRGRFARLVADDRVRIAPRHGRLVARPVPPLHGLLEVRGVGLLRRPHEEAALLRLVLDLSEGGPDRLPEAAEGVVVLCGIEIPRLFGRTGAPLWDIVLDRLSARDDRFMTTR
ncbi:MAG TPA: HPr kinase/phosphatase C-terminal domain-containing protein [Microvirga sp.]|jgi:GTPase SAR1 family protein